MSIRVLLIVSVAFGALVPGASNGLGSELMHGSRLIVALGMLEYGAMPALVEVYLRAATGTDPQRAALDALRVAHARPLGAVEARTFETTNLAWPQFFARKRNAEVVQNYNPAGDPTAGAALAALQNSQQTWSSVDGSLFRLAFGDLTLREVRPGDGFHDVNWADFGCGSSFVLLGVTTTIFDPKTMTIRDADVEMNNFSAPGCVYQWLNDGGDFDFETVILHENGHVAGLLAHSEDPRSVMYSSYQGLRTELDSESVDRVRSLYPADGHPLLPYHPIKPFHPAPPTVATAIAFLGDAAPGGGVVDSAFYGLRLNRDGDAAFAADVIDGGIGAGEAVFRWQGGTLTELARTAQPAPGGGNLGSALLGSASLDDEADVSFAFRRASAPNFPFGLDAGVYRASEGNALEAILIPDLTVVPGGGTFHGADSAESGSDGLVVFSGAVDALPGLPASPGISAGVYRLSGASITVVAAPGMPAPGGGTFDHASKPSVNAAGDVAFTGHRAEDGECYWVFETTCDASIFVLHEPTGALEQIARRGDPAPGGGTFNLLSGPVVNDGGDVLFLGIVGTGPDQVSGLFMASEGTIRRVVREGDPMPFSGNVVSLPGPVVGDWAINDAGEIAFEAFLDTDVDSSGGMDSGLYATLNGRLRLVARTGTELSGLGTIATVVPPSFTRPALPWRVMDIDMNDAGDILFQATLADGRGVLLLGSP